MSNISTLPTSQWQNDYQKAQRNRKLADFLMQESMTPTQGQMAGRYYVGPGIGDGLVKLGNALLSRNLNKGADETENNALAARSQINNKALADFLTASSPVDGVKPDNQALGKALLQYQSTTGADVPDSIVKLMSGQGAGNKFGLNPTYLKDEQGNVVIGQLSETGGIQPVALPKGMSVAPQIDWKDAGGQFVGLGKFGGPVAQGPAKTVDPTSVYNQGQQNYRFTAEPELAARREVAVSRAKDALETQSTVSTAAPLLDRMDSIVTKLPPNALSYTANDLLSKFGKGNKEMNDAIGQFNSFAAQAQTVAKKQSGPQSDKDVQSYQAQMGVVADPSASIDQRIGALKAARQFLEILKGKYPQIYGGAAPVSAPAGGRPATVAPAATKPGAKGLGDIFGGM